MPKPQSSSGLEQTGIVLTGQVASRTRRKFEKKGGGFRYNIQLSILTKDGMVFAERWSDSMLPSDTPELGDTLPLPVRIQTYTSKSGTGMRLVWGPVQDSESF